jgi:hypothetical protein
VAVDIQVHIEPATPVYDYDAEEVNPLDVERVLVIERKQGREFPAEDLPTASLIIVSMVPARMQVQNPIAEWFAPGRGIRRLRGLMDDPRNGHGCKTALPSYLNR